MISIIYDHILWALKFPGQMQAICERRKHQKKKVRLVPFYAYVNLTDFNEKL